ncbi:FkbM family methyltransferase [Pseudooceanicola algae]|uniref:Protein-L-isoaspartate O-methyltransferase n=1 Tax=Pseudooceanicola algae TaxID=1537215 RepID=A0A418SJM7_9RHOB|nr:FkbM family methyltransferase [Pseudooceanicola algae]QPM91944.1 Protein-L-isoaspartate O-methyltransferase [Pseudooceanicola algae]
MAEYDLDGLRLVLPEDLGSAGIAAKLASGGYERDEAAAVRMRLKAGMRVLEFGAGLGFLTAIAARIAGPANVTSIEPVAAMLPVIRGNLERNGLAGVDLRHGAVAAGVDDEVEFVTVESYIGSALAETDQTGTLVPRADLDALLEEVTPQAVIMDVEGAEIGLFDNPWPVKPRLVVLELHPKRYGGDEIARIFTCMAKTGLAYDPGASRGPVVVFRRIRRKGRRAEG